MKKLAIIGGNGMLGSDLVKFLSSHFSVTSITKENYAEFIGKSFDVLVNANGNSKRFWANNNVLEDFNLSTVGVYKTIFDFKFLQYIYISSSDVYENHTSPAFTKETQTINQDNLSPYGFHKYLSELIVKKYVKDYLILRCSMILGKNLKKGPLYDIFHGKSLFISKNSKLQMITTEEIAGIIKLFFDNAVIKTTFNIGGVGTVSFNDLHTYTSRKPQFLKNSETQEYEMSVSRLKKVFKVKSSEEYLQQYIRLLKLQSL